MTTIVPETDQAGASGTVSAIGSSRSGQGTAIVGLWPGLLLTAGIAALSFALRAALPGLSALSPMFLAIVIGIAVQNIVGVPASVKPGVVFSLRRVLRLAIVLLGLQLTAEEVAEVGPRGLTIMLLGVILTLIFTKWLGRVLRVERRLAELIAVGTSICGASAVAACNTVTNAPDEDVAYAVACVTVFGSVAMLGYPLLPKLLQLSPQAYGLWTGTSIHEIAQVVAAAYQDGKQAGDFATVAKLSRVMLLAPVVIVLGLRSWGRDPDRSAGANRLPMPWFVLGFIALVGINSVVTIPSAAKSIAVPATTFLLSIALAAMGLETDVARLRARGLRPLMLGLAASLFISGLTLLLILGTSAA